MTERGRTQSDVELAEWAAIDRSAEGRSRPLIAIQGKHLAVRCRSRNRRSHSPATSGNCFTAGRRSRWRFPPFLAEWRGLRHVRPMCRASRLRSLQPRESVPGNLVAHGARRIEPKPQPTRLPTKVGLLMPRQSRLCFAMWRITRVFHSPNLTLLESTRACRLTVYVGII
jgi:hypothetical protein